MESGSPREASTEEVEIHISSKHCACKLTAATMVALGRLKSSAMMASMAPFNEDTVVVLGSAG